MNSTIKLKKDLIQMKRKRSGQPAGKESPWIVRPRPIENPVLRVFCLPYAGGASGVYQAWPEYFADDRIEICMIQLPGRENRMMDTMPEDIYILIKSIMTGMGPFLEDETPYVIYGHCMGSLISHELLRQMRHSKMKLPVHFFPAAHYTPALLQADTKPTSHLKHLSIEEFFKLAEELGGTDGAILSDPSTGALIIPTLKADYWAYASYEYRPEAPFDFPITVFFGTHDYLVKEHEVKGWQAETTQKCEFYEIDGDHFFVVKEKEKLLPLLREKLNDVIRAVSQVA